MPTTSNSGPIRSATPGDAARITEIARAAYRIYVARLGREPAPMLDDYAKQIAERRCVVLEWGGRITGFMIAWPEVDAYFVENVAVDPDSQGRGYGRHLMEHAVAEARRLGLPALRLYTNVAMDENLAMYSHQGFVETHRAIENGYHLVYMLRAL